MMMMNDTKKRLGLPAWGGSIAAAALVIAFAVPASALDAYRDRRGLFSGVGIGGGAAIQGGEPGGELLIELAVGGGITQDLTLALDLDVWFQLLDDENQNWLVVPGPELNYFITDGLFVRVGIGLALAFIQGEKIETFATPGKDVDETDFTLGFDGSVGLGYEFFANSNLAFGMAIEGDYFLLDDHEDVVGISLSVGIRYY